MQEEYPKAMEKFLSWIDKYKEENNWLYLFNGIDSETDLGDLRKAPKFHDLPVAIQFGIFMQFNIEVSEEYFKGSVVMIDFIYRSLLQDSQDIIENTIMVLEKIMNG